MEILETICRVNYFLGFNSIKPNPESLKKLEPLMKDNYLPSISDIFIDNNVKKIITLQKKINEMSIKIEFHEQGVGIETICEFSISDAYESIKNIIRDINEKLKLIYQDTKSYRVSGIVNTIIKSDYSLSKKLKEKYTKIENDDFQWSIKMATIKEISNIESYEILMIDKQELSRSTDVSYKFEGLVINCDTNTVIKKDNQFSLNDSDLALKLLDNSISKFKSIFTEA